MVLPTYRSLKEGSQGCHAVSSPSAGTGLRRSSNTGSVASYASASNLDLSSLTLSNQSGSHLSSYNNDSRRNQDTLLKRGWGSAETRRASTSLNTMVGGASTENHFDYSRRSSQPPLRVVGNNQLADDEDGYGYFVDVTEDDEQEDALMW